jgi:hypothetical protein
MHVKTIKRAKKIKHDKLNITTTREKNGTTNTV